MLVGHGTISTGFFQRVYQLYHRQIYVRDHPSAIRNGCDQVSQTREYEQRQPQDDHVFHTIKGDRGSGPRRNVYA